MLGHSKRVLLVRDDVLYKPGQSFKYVYFPIECIVSLLYEVEDGASIEIAMIGNEGMVGIAAFMGGESTPSRAIVINTGHAYRVSIQRIQEEFSRHEKMLALFLRYTQSLISHMAQTIICTRRHSLDQQLCRLILLFLDRSENNNICITHESVAKMLGVRRESVTTEAGKLKKLGAVQYHRGGLVVLDRSILEQHCCECYQVVKSEAERLFPTLKH